MTTLTNNKINAHLAIDAKEPTRANPTDAGLDLYAYGSYWIHPGDTTLVDTGVALAIPEGHVGLLIARSSTYKTYSKAMLANAVGVIDSDYRGTIKANIKADDEPIIIKHHAKLVQLVVVPVFLFGLNFVETIADLGFTDRGDGGFGSSGAK